MEPPWEHPDWYDLHDTAFTAGSEREPEHYRELLLALPPLGESDHLVDIGAGTGKLSHLIARGYPELGRVTLIEPNEVKLRRARARLAEALPRARIDTLAMPAGQGKLPPSRNARVAVFGSVLMPVLEFGDMAYADRRRLGGPRAGRSGGAPAAFAGHHSIDFWSYRFSRSAARHHGRRVSAFARAWRRARPWASSAAACLRRRAAAVGSAMPSWRIRSGSRPMSAS